MKKIILASTILYSLSASDAQAIYRYDFKSKEPTIEINLGALKHLQPAPIAMRPEPVLKGTVTAPMGAESSPRISVSPAPVLKPKTESVTQKPVEGRPWAKDETPQVVKPKTNIVAPADKPEPKIKVDVPPPPPAAQKKPATAKPSEDNKKLTPAERKAEAQAKRQAEAQARREEAQAKRQAEAKARREEAQAKRQAEAKAKREAEAKKEETQPKPVSKKESANDRISKLPPLAPPPPPPAIENKGTNNTPRPSLDEPEAEFKNPNSPDSAALPSLDELFGNDNTKQIDNEDRIVVPPAPKVSAVPAPPPVKEPKVGKPEIDTVMIKPQELPKISLPSFSEDKPHLSVPFAEAEVEFPISEQARLIEVVEMMNSDESLVVKVVAFASGTEEQASQAKRTALARALSVRKIFKERNIASDRMIIRPLGNKAADGVPDRVDIFLSKKTGT